MAQQLGMNDLGFFSGIDQTENFASLKNILFVREMAASAHPSSWPTGEALALPETFDAGGEILSVADFLADGQTAALLVLQDGRIRFERYWLTGGPETQWLSMSVAKSHISALIGIAVDQGLIDISRPISDYVSVAPGSAYDGVSVKHVLQMSSGARWNEDYTDRQSDVALMSRNTRFPDGSLEAYVCNEMVKESAPGTVCQYNSGDTQILGALVSRATGRTLSDYMRTELAEPLGYEQPGYWILDPQGAEVGYAGLNLTARDFARLGELYRNGGEWNGRRIVSRDWVEASTTVETPVQAPGNVLIGGVPRANGYGYQWWIPPGGRGSFRAIGVYNQFIVVDPITRSVIVKLSANQRYSRPDDVITPRHDAFFNALISALEHGA